MFAQRFSRHRYKTVSRPRHMHSGGQVHSVISTASNCLSLGSEKKRVQTLQFFRLRKNANTDSEMS